MQFTPDFVTQQVVLLKSEIQRPADEEIALQNIIICEQHETTSRIIRQWLLTCEKGMKLRFKDVLLQYTDVIDRTKLESTLVLERSAEEQKKKSMRRLSIDLHKDTTTPEKEEEDDTENITQLRQRLMQGRTKSFTKAQTMDEELQEEETTQEEILKNMLGLVRGIKESAGVFQQKLDADQGYIDAATSGLTHASSKIGKTSINLKKVAVKLGWWETLKMLLIFVSSFLVCLLLIMIIPRF